MDPNELIGRALAARERAYAPYSHYKVGAAILTDTELVYTGCNVENASYGLTICAERTAVTKMVSDGEQKIVSIAVVTDDGASMCGACRQVVSEFGREATVYLASSDGKFTETTVDALLPGAFDGGKLKRSPDTP